MVEAITIKDKTIQRLRENKKKKSYSVFIDECMDKLGYPAAKIKE